MRTIRRLETPSDAVCEKLFSTLLAAQPRSWRAASITSPAAGQTYLQGWTFVQTSDSATFTRDATGHGMTVRGRQEQGGQIDQARIELDAVSK